MAVWGIKIGRLPLLAGAFLAVPGVVPTSFAQTVIPYNNGDLKAAPIILIDPSGTVLTLPNGVAEQSGDISETGGPKSLFKTGAGELILSGTNTYTGATNVLAGKLTAASDTALSAASDFRVNKNAWLTLDDGVEAHINSLANGPLGGGRVIIGANDPLTTLFIGSNGGATTTFGGSITGAGNLELDGGSLTLNGADSKIGGDLTIAICGCRTGGLTLAGANFDVGGSVTVSNGKLAVTLGGVLTQLDPTQGLGASDSNILVDGSGSKIDVAGLALLSNSSLTVSNGGQFKQTAAIPSLPGFFADASTILVEGAGSSIDVTGLALSNGSLSVLSGGKLSQSDKTTGLAVDSGAMRIDGAGSRVDVAGQTSITGTTHDVSLVIANGGVLKSRGSAVLAGLLASPPVPQANAVATVTGTGSLWDVGKELFLGTFCPCSDDPATLNVVEGGLVKVAADIVVGAAATLNIGTGGLAGTVITPAIKNAGQLVANFTDTSTLGAAISGAGTLTKNGSGKLVLTGASTYTGATAVNSGTLAVNGSIANSTVTVNSGGTLSGNGTVGTTVVKGTLAAGNSPGTLKINGDLTLGVGSTSRFELNTPGVASSPSNDLVNITGNLTLGGTLLAPGAVSGYYRLFNVGGIVTGTYTTVPKDSFVFANVPHQVNLLVATDGQIVQFWDGADLIGDRSVNGGSGTWNVTRTNWTGIPGASINDSWRNQVGIFAGTAGTVTVSGPVGFQGLQFSTTGYTIAGGPLQLFGNPKGNAAASFVNVDGGINVTIASALTGASIGLDKLGTGTLILTGNNTYTGATTVAAGTLRAGSAGAFVDNTRYTVNGGTLDLNGFDLTMSSFSGTGGLVSLGAADLVVNQSSSTGFSGIIGGAGTLTKAGSGKLTLTGANTYSGGTIIQAGALQIGNGGTTGSIVGNVAIGGTLIFDRSNALRFDGVISDATGGAGKMIKNGTGTLILSGKSTFSGATTVNAGTLSVNGSIGSSTVTVNRGGTLAGNGTVGTTIVKSGGTISPGNSIGTLTVRNGLTLASGSRYKVEVGNGSDLIRVIAGPGGAGKATLGGLVQAFFGTSGQVKTTVLILTTAGGVTGKFTGVTDNLPTVITSLKYDSKNVYLVSKLSFSNLKGLTINQANVAGAIDSFFAGKSSFDLAFARLDAAGLTTVSGELGTAAIQSGFIASDRFMDAISDRFVLAGGSSAAEQTDASAYAMNDSAGSVATGVYAALLDKKSAYAMGAGGQWKTWGAAYGATADLDGDETTVGSHDLGTDLWGLASGIGWGDGDRSFGVALGGGHSNFDLAGGLGSGETGLFNAGIYGRAEFGDAYFLGAAAYGYQDVSTSRSAFGDILQGSYGSHSFSGRGELGYRFDTPVAGLIPYAAFQGTSLHIPSYSETSSGAGTYALNYDGRTATDARGELGLRFDKTMMLSESALFALTGRAAWAHSSGSDRSMVAGFQSLPGSSFTVYGAVPARDSALLDLGARVAWNNGLSASAMFQGQFADGYSLYSGSVKLGFSW